MFKSKETSITFRHSALLKQGNHIPTHAIDVPFESNLPNQLENMYSAEDSCSCHYERTYLKFLPKINAKKVMGDD